MTMTMTKNKIQNRSLSYKTLIWLWVDINLFLFLLYSGSEGLDINNLPVIKEKTDAEIDWNYYTDEGLPEEKAEISPKGVSSLPGNISFIFNYISFSSSNTQFYESRIFCLFTFWVFFPDKSCKLVSKYTKKCQYNS